MADSPASFQPLNAHTSAGALRPSGRRSQRRGCIAFTVAGCVRRSGQYLGVAAITSLRPGDEVAGVYACTRKDRLLARTGTPYLALELRDRTGALPGRAFKDADVLAGRFDRGELVRVRGRVERFRDELQVEVSTSRGRRRPTPRSSSPSRTGTSTSSTASSSTWRARSTTRRTPGCWSGCSATTRCGRSGGARRARAAGTTPTSAGCSSTRWRWGRSCSRPARCTRGSTPIC